MFEIQWIFDNKIFSFILNMTWNCSPSTLTLKIVWLWILRIQIIYCAKAPPELSTAYKFMSAFEGLRINEGRHFCWPVMCANYQETWDEGPLASRAIKLHHQDCLCHIFVVPETYYRSMCVLVLWPFLKKMNCYAQLSLLFAIVFVVNICYRYLFAIVIMVILCYFGLLGSLWVSLSLFGSLWVFLPLWVSMGLCGSPWNS